METVVHSEETTEALLGRAQKGERAALDEIAKRYEQRLRALILTRLNAALRTMVDAEDVLQETFMRAFRSIKNLHWQGEASFFGWLSMNQKPTAYGRGPNEALPFRRESLRERPT